MNGRMPLRVSASGSRSVPSFIQPPTQSVIVVDPVKIADPVKIPTDPFAGASPNPATVASLRRMSRIKESAKEKEKQEEEERKRLNERAEQVAKALMIQQKIEQEAKDAAFRAAQEKEKEAKREAERRAAEWAEERRRYEEKIVEESKQKRKEDYNKKKEEERVVLQRAQQERQAALKKIAELYASGERVQQERLAALKNREERYALDERVQQERLAALKNREERYALDERVQQVQIKKKVEEQHIQEWVEKLPTINQKSRRMLRKELKHVIEPDLSVNHAQHVEHLKRISDRAERIILDSIACRSHPPPTTRIHVFLLCFNESYLLPHMIAHYRAYLPSCHITIYDNESSDDSVAIAKRLGCEVISWSSNNMNDERLKIKIRNYCWNYLKDGWIIMADMDEWICVTEEDLRREEEQGTTILTIKGLDMMGESQKDDLSDLDFHAVDRYVPFKDEDKNLCFLRNRIQTMNWGAGSHHCKPRGKIQYSDKTYYNKHMCNMGLPFLQKKMRQRHERSLLNRSKGWSIHYVDDMEKVAAFYKKRLESSQSTHDIQDIIPFPIKNNVKLVVTDTVITEPLRMPI